MAIICPTITAYTEEQYKEQIHKVVHLCHRIHIDLSDGIFTDEPTVNPEDAWWPAGFQADFHLMFKHPYGSVKKILRHQPHLMIVHAEAEGNFNEVEKLCHHHNVKVGIALLPQTQVQVIKPALPKLDHVLIFSGNLGHQGGSQADLSLLDKAAEIRKLKPDIEIGWDGGVNDQNVAELVSGGIDVINVGGYIQSADDPAKAFDGLQRIADETDET